MNRRDFLSHENSGKAWAFLFALLLPLLVWDVLPVPASFAAPTMPWDTLWTVTLEAISGVTGKLSMAFAVVAAALISLIPPRERTTLTWTVCVGAVIVAILLDTARGALALGLLVS